MRAKTKQFLVLLSFCWMTACSSFPAKAVSEHEAIAIAQAELTRREKWPLSARVRDNIDKGIICQSTQKSDGSRLIVGHRAEIEEDTGNSEYLPHTRRTVVISRSGKVSAYADNTADER